MTNRRTEHIFCAVFLTVILFFACTIAVRTFTRQIVVKRMGVTNAFTELVFFDEKGMNNAAGKDIDWEALYPFAERTEPLAVGKQMADLFAGYREAVKNIISRIESYTSEHLVGRSYLVEIAKAYEKAIRWNYISYAEYNGVVWMSDAYLTGVVPLTDISAQAEATIGLARDCKALGAYFLYIQAPYKISKYEDTDMVMDYSNQNADAFLAHLQSAGVDTADFRELIHQERLPHHKLFYRTDHHWKVETGLWASRHILRILNEKYGYDFDVALLSDDKMKSTVYPGWFLGSQGKKVTLARTEPEDFTLLCPNYPTDLHYELLSKGINTDGDFSILLDRSKLEEKDYYGKNPYATYIYGDQALERIENHKADNSKRVLIIHDSFSDCVIPFLSLSVKYVDALDLRHFTGSVRNFISTTQPDAVILMYNPGMLKLNEKTMRTFDFQ